MADEKAAGLGDGQGTRVGAPDQATHSPANHNDGPSERAEKTTGAGAEATRVDKDASEHTHEHLSGYGGKGGQPKTSSDTRE